MAVSNREMSGINNEGIYPDVTKPAVEDKTIENIEEKSIDNQDLASEAENQCTDLKTESISLTETKGHKMPRWIYLGIMFSMVLVSTGCLELPSGLKSFARHEAFTNQ